MERGTKIQRCQNDSRRHPLHLLEVGTDSTSILLSKLGYSLGFPIFSAVSKEGSTGPRTGFFHDFSRASLLAKRYNAQTEDIEEVSEEDHQRLRADLRGLDPHLGAYPYDTWKKWISLTNRISANTITRYLHKFEVWKSQFHALFNYFQTGAALGQDPIRDRVDPRPALHVQEYKTHREFPSAAEQEQQHHQCQ